MNMKRAKRVLLAEVAQGYAVSRLLAALDKSVPVLRTVFLIVGIVTAGFGAGRLSDYVFAAGLLLHFTIWFERWWRQAVSK
jgi:hypothetical protein